MESREIVVMRLMEWERVKGSLRAILHTYFAEGSEFVEAEKAIENFIAKVDENDLFG